MGLWKEPIRWSRSKDAFGYSSSHYDAPIDSSATRAGGSRSGTGGDITGIETGGDRAGTGGGMHRRGPSQAAHVFAGWFHLDHTAVVPTCRPRPDRHEHTSVKLLTARRMLMQILTDTRGTNRGLKLAPRLYRRPYLIHTPSVTHERPAAWHGPAHVSRQSAHCQPCARAGVSALILTVRLPSVLQSRPFWYTH